MELRANINLLATEMLDEIGSVDILKEIHTGPPKEAVLATRGTRIIYIEGGWGPAVPYHGIRHEDGTQNHGYRPVKGNPSAIESLPEVKGYPEFAEFLVALNASETEIESVGCEKLAVKEAHEQREVYVMSCYVDIIFSDLSRNEDPFNHLRLAAELAASMEGCEGWWTSVELGLQRLRGLPGCDLPWGLLIRVRSAGRSEDDARRTWGHSFERLKQAIVA